MPRTNQARVFFGNGEWDPRLYGRTDLPGYQGALAIMENFFPTPLGGARYRDGLRTRFILPSQRHPDRLKLVRAPGYLGAAERILLLDGTTGTGQIEAFAFPYEGNTRFTRTDLWTRSESRASPGTFTPLSSDIHRARVAFGDYAGTMLTHRSFAPIHIGSSAITSTLLSNQRVLLTIDGTTSHLWQLSRTNPLQSIDLGRMPGGFSGAHGMTYFNDEVLAVSSLGPFFGLYTNALWLVDQSDPRASRRIGSLNIPNQVTGLATDGTTLYACTARNEVWRVNRNITSAAQMIGFVPADGSFTIGSLTVDFTRHDLTSMAYVNGQAYAIGNIESDESTTYSAVWNVDLANPANSSVVTGILSIGVNRSPVSLSSYGSGLLTAQPAGSGREANLLTVDLSGGGMTLPVGNLPSALRNPTSMAGFDVEINVTEQLGDLLDEGTSRSANTMPPNVYFQPKNYVDHLGNHEGEGAHPACSTVFLNRMIFAGSDYLPGTFIGSERYPRAAADLDIDDTEAQGAMSFLFDGRNGEAIATYNFYWLFYHPLKKALESWEAVQPSDSFSYKINAQRELAIVWMVPYNNYLVLGTTQGVWIARDLDPSTPPEVTQYSNIPCADLDPVVTDFGIAYANASRKEVHFANLGVGFEPPVRQNAMAFARHLTEGTTIRQLAWQATPQRRLWLLTDDGRLAAWCFEPDANVLGWTRCTNEFLLFCGVCVMPGPETELVCVAAYEPSASGGLETIYLTTLDGRDHLDLGVGAEVGDFADDAIVPTGRPGEDYVIIGDTTLRVGIFVPMTSIALGAAMELSANVTGLEASQSTLEWSIISGPGSLSSLTELRTFYTAPGALSEDTLVTVRVIARGPTETASDDATFTVSLATLIVTLSNLVTVYEGESARIDAVVTGTATGPITYQWSLVSGPGTLTPSSDGAYATFQAPETVTGAMSVTVSVTVQREGRSAIASEIFNVDDIVGPGEGTLFVNIVSRHQGGTTWEVTATVGGSATGAITYSWSLSGGGSLSNANSRTATVTGGVAGSSSVTVNVTRNQLQASDSDLLVADADPTTLTVSISGATTVERGDTVSLTATVGGTAEGTITHSWVVLSGPGSIPSSAPLSGAVYTAPTAGTAEETAIIQVSVGRENLSAEDTHVITIEATEPPEPTLTVSITRTDHPGFILTTTLGRPWEERQKDPSRIHGPFSITGLRTPIRRRLSPWSF